MLPSSSPEVYGSVVREEDDDAELAGDAEAPLALRFSVAVSESGERLDKMLATRMPVLSRSRLKQWIEGGAVRVNGSEVRPRHAMAAGDLVEIEPRPPPEATAFTAEAMALDIVYEDDALIVIDKPPGLVVHPAAGHWSGTLLNGLLAHDATLAELPRAGIVHRLDADTSGLMVVARTLRAHTELVRQLQARTVRREYWAIVLGEPRASGTIDAPIGRDPRNPLRFRVSHAANARAARTYYARIATQRHDEATLSWLSLRLETGRTHQIRVHCEYIGHPLIGDPVYRRRLPQRAAAIPWRAFQRQALHACQLGLQHPLSGAAMQWFRAPPADLAELMGSLQFGPIDRPLGGRGAQQ
ncbi:MAG TPA: RluA family pseudouridine synthase [Burkholderiaceae bacterium]|nr:RluA family pseudouridine synthase [Burkholderiaceae bacterium]